ncbi:MAG: hypothetical protein KKH12_04245 [Gammaproteobacteria bacterium]|nr:hypothetical protein [Gammaproteobacteria bacterium]MBU1480869.1 hypothetical protein [Gammaproteobacteria bacterium]
MLGIICLQDKFGKPKSGVNRVLFISLSGSSCAYSAVMKKSAARFSGTNSNLLDMTGAASFVEKGGEP